MSGENVTTVTDALQDKQGEEGDARQRSTISFPYNNLNDAIEVAQAIHKNVGTGECDDSQLAAWMNMSPKSSGYRIQVSASRMFGLVETAAGQHKMSSLARMIVDPQREREARSKAFLKVPLYSALFEKYKGGVVPPAAALERDIVSLGVAEKQKERARQIFERSAEQGGFSEHGKERLVQPGIAGGLANHTLGENGGKGDAILPLPPAPPPPPPPPATDELHPFIQGLLKTLPPPDSDWPASGRTKWLQTAANIFDLIYKGEGGGIRVEIANAARSPRPD